MSWITFEVKTARRAQLVDITERVAAAVERSAKSDGVCHVFVPHTTAGVTINEGADPDVARDVESLLGELVPKEAAFQHAEGNSDSHIKTVLVPSGRCRCNGPLKGESVNRLKAILSDH